MKNTIVMVAVIATFLLTWMSLSTIGWVFGDISFKETATHGGTIMLMMLFGWIPAVIVAFDVSENLEG
jgi:hypothetical protein